MDPAQPAVLSAASAPSASARAAAGRTSAGAVERARAFWAMTRPGVVALVFFTGVPMLGLAEGGWPPVGRSLLLLAGIAAIAGASSVFNAFLERHLDARMARTRGRPLPTGVVQPAEALVFGALLTAAGLGLIGAVGHPLGVLIGALTVAFYVFVYTVWLKPRTPLNIVIGGAAGAAPPLIVDAALHGSVGLASVSLFAVVFLWTPPHFWAISLFRKDDYANAGFPMLPLTHGDEATRRRIVLYALSMIPPSLMLVPTGQLSVGYGLAALAIGGWFVWRCVALLRERSDAAARGVMFASLLHLHLLCTAMTLDLLV